MNDRFIGIDFGLSKVWLSISDPLKIISIPLKVIKYKNRKELLSKLQEIALENDVKSFVVGYPLNMNNKKNEMTKLVDDFFVELKNLNFNVFLQDERLSSESAKKIMREQNIKTGNNKEHIDLSASTIILQSFLDKGIINEWEKFDSLFIKWINVRFIISTFSLGFFSLDIFNSTFQNFLPTNKAFRKDDTFLFSRFRKLCYNNSLGSS